MDISFDRVRRAIARIDAHKTYRRATSPEAIYLYQISAAQKHGVFEPFTPEQKELNAWLLSVQAGRALVVDAWAAFMTEAGGAEGSGSQGDGTGNGGG